MALDGAFLRHVKKELGEKLTDARLDKIYQPNRDELVLAFRTREAAYKLLISARANSARVHFTEIALENPKQPPMLCMLLRKKLTGGRLTRLTQPGLERVLVLEFDCINELGDHVALKLSAEIMGKYSNVILIDENDKIIDALKRVDAEMSSQRLVLPGLQYQLPPQQDKISPLDILPAELCDRLKVVGKDAELSKALLSTLQGLSPIVCRELQQLAGRGRELHLSEMSEEDFFRLSFHFQKLKERILDVSGEPFIISDKSGKPIDFSFMDITQYGLSVKVSRKDSFSQLLDDFFRERDSLERMKVKSQDLLRVLSSVAERLGRKIDAQQKELSECSGREQYKIFGDILNANLHNLEKGAALTKLQNFYDESLPDVEIPLDPMLTPSQNAQRYYKKYRKAKTAEEKLAEQIALSTDELTYIDTVFEALSEASNERELSEIRSELAEVGYIRKSAGRKNREEKLSAPLEFVTQNGFSVLVGKNNRQNDLLTLKQAKKGDIWFHTKNIPGSHTVLVTDGKEPPQGDLAEAAVLAAKHSKAKNSSQVPVDYTTVKNVSKPQGAKPGMVIYVHYKTIYVNPQE